MGDPNASIPTPQPVHYRPMFGAFGGALTAGCVSFVSAAALEAGIGEALGLRRPLVVVRNTRGGIGKRSMIHNDAMPIIEVDQAQQVIVIKRSLSPGFAGIDNDLFYEPNTSMLFADAKQAAGEIAAEIENL